VVSIDVNIRFPCMRDVNYFSRHSIIVMEMSFLHDTKYIYAVPSLHTLPQVDDTVV
jgi:hypothetical protein